MSTGNGLALIARQPRRKQKTPPLPSSLESNRRTRATLCAVDLREPQVKPDRTQVQVDQMQSGDRLGWLTLVERPKSTTSPLLVRCICGVVNSPLAWAVAAGAVRSCGLLSGDHGIH